MKHYRSSIPKVARERVLATHLQGPQKYKAEYRVNRKIVGVRQFDQSGQLELERPMRNGLLHGTLYSCDDGVVTFAEPYRAGLAHGTARQWSEDGELIGTYAMKHGTGLDLWRQKTNWGTGRVILTEARYIKDGKWHGFEWWLNEDQKSVHDEHHFWNNLQHGIQRSWNSKERLRRGYPRYWVNNKQVTKREYLSASANDSNLPPFRESDNRPRRKFPLEVLAAIDLAANR
jgi:antitoxin component YwqK of YwqJK toxin-antitoxin module